MARKTGVRMGGELIRKHESSRSRLEVESAQADTIFGLTRAAEDKASVVFSFDGLVDDDSVVWNVEVFVNKVDGEMLR